MKAIIALVAGASAVVIEKPILAATAQNVEIKSWSNWKPAACAKAWEELPSNAKTYTQKLVSDLCTNGVTPGQRQQCTSWEPVLDQAVCGLMANPECPATTWSDADCKKCFNRKQENNQAWTGMSTEEKTWVAAALWGRGKNAEVKLKAIRENAAAAVNKANETARDSEQTAKVALREPLGDNNDNESIEFATLEKLHGEALYCALRVTAHDKCGSQTSTPSCQSHAEFFFQK